ncbi:hypothetical protein GLAREA_08834 [Glarea lozoyensis ATCC 20868]|uniref:Uncharacterized protein n=1 Tax=Glarea lozoyensis (strain ATCC 20868 / MF5171) TaxID=1116229 RepID=S3DXL0_GLAL2|nr:uncharacterized protein GLAREA_08834 [Glarea lozoyensis ATCC 20868]EPE36671.1 hypothetical protein GLAREA_08834 [Glarea lozoyensis ATCC 20868]
MAPIFCCTQISPFRPTRTDHDAKFQTLLTWAKEADTTTEPDADVLDLLENQSAFVIQIVRQVNYGPLEFKRYFTPSKDGSGFVELTEKALIDANFQKLNSYKNYRCSSHDKFFEFNLYQKDPVNKHHWRANIARPATEIDL